MTIDIEKFAIVAGQQPSGELVVEQLEGVPTEQQRCYRLIKSPLFVSGIAAGDQIKLLDESPGAFKLICRGGNLAIRVLSKADVADLARELVPAMETLGAVLDIESPRALVFSIHVSIGFNAIEEVLNQWTDGTLSVWQYGNVYDTDEHSTPLNWWNESAFST